MTERLARVTVSTIFVILNVLFLSGCATAPLYTPADEQGPPADFSGGWIGEGGGYLLVLQQTGARVTGTWCDQSVEGLQLALEGEVKGRVLHMKSAKPSDWFVYRLSIDLDLVLSPNGETGQGHFTLKGSRAFDFGFTHDVAEKSYRVVLGPATNYIACTPGTDNGWFRGGIICQLPVDAKGMTAMKTYPVLPIRRVFVVAGYTADMGAGIKMVPIDEPRCINYHADVWASALGNAVRAANLWALRARSGVTVKQSFQVKGETCWAVMTPDWSTDVEGVMQTRMTPSTMVLEFYNKDPDLGGAPVGFLGLAFRDAQGTWGPWGSRAGSPPCFSSYTVFRPTIRAGQPVGFEVVPDAEPPLNEGWMKPSVPPGDPKSESLKIARWKMGILLQAKNQTLPKLLKDKPTAGLQDLVTVAERAVLDASHFSEVMKDRAQQALEKGGDPSVDREWSAVYNEHLSVLNAIVAAIKEELANRAR